MPRTRLSPIRSWNPRRRLDSRQRDQRWRRRTQRLELLEQRLMLASDAVIPAVQVEFDVNHDGVVDHSLPAAAAGSFDLGLPLTEGESVLSIKIDYSLDASGFFNDQTRRNALQQVADGIAARLGDTLAPVPAPISNVDVLVLSLSENPATGGKNYTAPFPGAIPSFRINRTSISTNEVVVYVGSQRPAGQFGRFWRSRFLLHIRNS